MATNSASAATLQLDFRNQQGLVFSGPVTALSSLNSKGTFDVLPQHAHFISLISERVIIFPVGGGQKQFNIGQGVLRCFDNKVEIFAGLDSQVTIQPSPHS